MSTRVIETKINPDGSMWKEVELKYNDFSVAKLRSLYDEKLKTSLADIFINTKKVVVAYRFVSVVFFLICCYFLMKCFSRGEVFYVLDVLLLLSSLKVLSMYRDKCSNRQSMIVKCYREMFDVIDYMGRGAKFTAGFLPKEHMKDHLYDVSGNPEMKRSARIPEVPDGVDGVLVFKMFEKPLILLPISSSVFDLRNDKFCLDIDKCAYDLINTLTF